MATLLEQWRNTAYDAEMNRNNGERFWKAYFDVEKGFYRSLLTSGEEVSGTIPELAEKYGVKELVMVGILDGINESLVMPNPIETMDEETQLSLAFDPEKLYKNMVLAKADWLYGLPEWERYFDQEKREELYRIAKRSGTVVKGKKIFPNDPCPCGSGKKYKKCHGRNL